MSLYPPYLLGGVRMVAVATDLRGCRVRVRHGLLNRNLNGTVFGGTLYSAADPIYAVLFWQIFAREGRAVRVWTRSASVRFRAPVTTSIEYDFHIDDDVVDRARSALDARGKFEQALHVAGVAPDGKVCVEIETVVHLAAR
ncbi:DUF4442 domain-containing protein [Engelhardtia mirabilis]|uniref:Thioesterase (YiiD_Cterm) n=2 Tax=Engelhardtia mirabilis TaxID=2528011 RepID=A0A518BLH6_9BACT|nr:Putative thioesterase (yiiD_Cterm) [Planctomycetes bacterium Pla133]QDV02156.1 Putative thioesterase (yiiD_Cterm) [Planctomycetes bacterium Pla86]